MWQKTMLFSCGWWMIIVVAESGMAVKQESVKQESEKPKEKAPVLLKNKAPLLAEQDVTYEYDDRLVVMLMGDPQLPMTDESEANVKKAMRDINQIKHDYMAVLGDLIQPVGSHANKVARYNMYSELVLRTARKPVFSISGNADCGVGLDYYHQATGLPNHYVVERRGIRFIFLGTTRMSGKGRHICHVGEKGMHFLEEELGKDKETTTVVCPPLHAALHLQHDKLLDRPYLLRHICNAHGHRQTF